jgi:hypothetical protein
VLCIRDHHTTGFEVGPRRAYNVNV